MPPAPTAVPYRARAERDGTVVADSTAAVRVDPTDGPPELWFPAADVADGAAVDGDRAGGGDLAGHVRLDPARTVIDLLDERDAGAPAVTRFPNWGDADDLITILDVRPVDDGSYRSEARSHWQRPVVEGSQMLAQTLVAGARLAPGRRAVHASMVFPRAAAADAPYAVELDPVTDGRTFTALRTAAVQDGRTCGFGTLLLDATAPDLIRHAEPAPAVPGPDEAVPYDMGVTGRDLRVVDGAYTGDPGAPVGPPELHAWVRFREVPDDPAVHAALLAQFTGHLPIAAALRPHAGVGQSQAHRTISTAINAISLSLHADVRADRWMRYDHRSTFAGDGMTHAECRVVDEDGLLLASFTVDAMIRGFADRSAAADPRTAM